MRAAAYVGRVGGLAVALGIGVVTGGLGVAWAAPAEPSDASASVDSAASPDSGAQAPAPRSRTARAARPARDVGGDHGARGAVTAPSVAGVTGAERNSAAKIGLTAGAERAASALVPRSAQPVMTRRVNLPSVSDPSTFAAPVVAHSVVGGLVSSVVPAAVVDVPQMVATPPQAVAADAVEAVWSPLLGSSPGVPTQSPVSWMVLAVARREFGQQRTTSAPAAVIPTGQTLAPAPASAAAVVPLAAAAVAISPDGSKASVIGTIAVGSVPLGVAVNRAGTRAYVTNLSGNSVSVINTADSTVAATIAVGQRPSGVALNADGTRAYVTNSGGNSVSVIDTATNKVTATITVGSSPMGVAVSPNGSRVLVTNSGGNSVSVIDAATNKVTATLKVGSAPTGVAFSPSGNRAWVTNSVGNSVSMIKMTKLKVKRTIAVGSVPTGIAVMGGSAYVSTESGTVKVINTSTKTVIATVSAGSNLGAVAVSADGASLYATDYGNGTMAFINTATNQVTRTIAFGSAPWGVASSRDGTRIYVANRGGDTVWVIGANSAPVAGTAPTVGSPDASTGEVTGQVNAIDPDGDALFYSGPTTTSKGAVSVNGDGIFTYLPTKEARRAAYLPSAPAAEKSDTFEITVTDGNGGMVAVPVTVSISPAITYVSGDVKRNPATGTIAIRTFFGDDKPEMAWKAGGQSGSYQLSPADVAGWDDFYLKGTAPETLATAPGMTYPPGSIKCNPGPQKFYFAVRRDSGMFGREDMEWSVISSSGAYFTSSAALEGWDTLFVPNIAPAEGPP
jgi:YVTN family beta-propeller protein/VCBS repeat-containing protein